jgi:hypothetical protein
MMLWLIGWMSSAWADASNLISHAQSQGYQLNNKLVVTSTDSVVLKQLKHADVPTEAFPKIGETDKEMQRLLEKYPDHCVLHVTPDESVTEPIAGFAIQEYGNCTVDPNLRFTLSENGSKWTVVNHRNDPVAIQTFAMVCQDIALQTRLQFEDEMAASQSRYLYYGAAGLGSIGLFMNGNPDPGFSAREENRFWTSIFLFGTAYMLYSQRDVPQMYRIHKQDDLSNYYSKEQVERLLAKTFTPLEEPTPESIDASTDTDTADTEPSDAINADTALDQITESEDATTSDEDTSLKVENKPDDAPPTTEQVPDASNTEDPPEVQETNTPESAQ